MKLIIVDDSKSVHSFVKEIVGASVSGFLDYYDGREVTKALEMGLLDMTDCLILLDWEMPELNGIETLREIREKFSGVPILMMTSKNTMSNIVEAMEQGANDYIIKPFTAEILLSKVSQFLPE